MKINMFKEAIIHLERLKSIYETVNVAKKDIQVVEKIIHDLAQCEEISNASKQETVYVTTASKTNKKQTFETSVNLLFENRYDELQGTKLNYRDLYNSETVMEYIEYNPKTKVLRGATALDLKLLYCLLIGEKAELKGKKDELYEKIKMNIRARKRGKAFSKVVK